MLLCSSILLIALFFIFFYSSQLMREFGESFKESVTGKVTYATIERNLKKATVEYLEKYYKNEIGTGTLTIVSDRFIQYKLLEESDFVTTENDICKGYVLVKRNEEKSLITEAFLQCEKYKTKDFQDWRMGDVYE